MRLLAPATTLELSTVQRTVDKGVASVLIKPGGTTTILYRIPNISGARDPYTTPRSKLLPSHACWEFLGRVTVWSWTCDFIDVLTPSRGTHLSAEGISDRHNYQLSLVPACSTFSFHIPRFRSYRRQLEYHRVSWTLSPGERVPWSPDEHPTTLH